MVPPEILEFLRLPGRAFVIKGRAGTGKTLFALELAREYQLNHGDVLWANSRDTDPGSIAELEKVVGAEQHLRYADAVSPMEDALLAAEEDLPTALAALEDLALSAREAHRPLLVVDSLDGLTEGFSRSERARFVTAAVRLARRLNASLLLILETVEPDPADYLVDGVVVLRDESRDGARVRALYLEKLRGIALRRPAYAFTLSEGRFKAYVPQPEELPRRPVRPAARPDVEQRVSTGVADWDLVLQGGFPRGTAHLLEVVPEAVAEYRRLLLPLVLNQLNLGRGVVALLPPNDPAADFEAALLPFVGAPRKQAPALALRDTATLASAPAFGDYAVGPEERLAPLQVARTAHRERGPVVSVLSVDALVTAFGVAAAGPWLARWVGETRRSREDVDILLATLPEAVLLSAALADSRWRLDAAHEAILLRGRSPPTEHNFVIPSYARGFPETRLLPLH
ncbi:MAG TPA: gas vesicle protein GvpD P-loop domain-containing protein [Candidatus Thermoplasmatota archaeon]|nr:gas vesicle protein GvpD P-loop domain-containing protein [Candidatus Thermoplasmatota archaeon]